jgi:Tol biopolymer transport system component
MDVRLRRGAVLVSGVLLAAGLQVAATGAVERGAGGVTTRVSVADDEAQANERSAEPAISADGRYVAFVSKATNLVPGDTNRAFDVFVRDRRNGTTRLVSASSSGAPGNLRSGSPSISSDGRFVAFWSYSSNLVTGDTNDAVDVFVRDLQTETTERVSIGDDEAQFDGFSVDPEVSGNGRFVIFRTYPSLEPPSTPEQFVRDRAAGTTESVPAPFVDVAAISEHGRFVAFPMDSRLTPNDPFDGYSVYVLDRQTGTTRLASTKGFFPEAVVSISGNGRFVAYVASPRPHNRTASKQVFVRDMRSKTVKIASVNSRGVPGNNGAASPVLSRDGHYLAFWSRSNNLAPRMARGPLVYGHDLRTGVTRPISVNSRGEKANRQPGGGLRVTIAVSATGHVIAFSSPATNLVPHDTNGSGDVFVRVRRLR